MLGLTCILTAFLTVQAALAARYQRVSAERVLHDYAALGAEGVAQRLKTALAIRITNAFNSAATDHGAGPISVAGLRAVATGNARDVLDALGDSSHILRITATDSLAPLLRSATAELPSYAYFGMRWIPGASPAELRVFQPLRDGVPSAMTFTLSAHGASALLAKVIEKDPVLPASITHGATIAPGVGLRVVSAHGTVADRHFDVASPFHATLALDQPYGDLAVEVSVSEWLAPALVIGGLPRSRVPLLGSLLVLTIALTIAAADQIRRESELSRLREDFVSGVSHELRTPLAQIRMFAETIRLGRVRSPEENDRSLGIIENETRRLEHLVENLLHFSRAERGALRVYPARTNLTSLLQEVVTQFVPLAARSQSTIALALAPDVIVDVDAAAIRQIVPNLLDNAVKYGKSGQTITVRLTADDHRARIEVEDEGPGIDASDRPRIWERFWRSESARRAGIVGTGVGLAIVSDLVRLHGGLASARASGNGMRTGACIVVDLPLAGRSA
jgi:signal transduction histidine kinase